MKKGWEMVSKTAVVVALLGALPVVVMWAGGYPTGAELIAWVHGNLPLFLFCMVLLKTASIIYPPLPGVVLTLGVLPLVGLKWAYGVEIIGSILGASSAYFLGKRYGVRLLTWVLSEELTNRILKVRLKPGNQVEAAVMLRFAAGGALSDGLAWGASLIGLRYIPYITGHVISHVVTTLPIFYLIAASVQIHTWLVLVPAAVLAWYLLYRLKGRYFE
jgi:uncharacterized membrane protein YdjX (TVP38/TMEM64 family)